MIKSNIKLYINNVNIIICFCLLLMPNRLLNDHLLQTPLIETPKNGQTIRGVITIKGSLNISKFEKYEVSFAYMNDVTDTWFILNNSSDNPRNRELGFWDTSKITDGDYKLRIKVITSSYAERTTIVEDLKVRNYTSSDDNEISNNSLPTIKPQITQIINNEIKATIQPELEKDSNNSLTFSTANIKMILIYTAGIIATIFIIGIIYIKKK